MGVVNSVLMLLETVKTFRGYNVSGGIVQLSDKDMIEHLDDTYAEAIVCNISIKPGDALRQLQPVMFNTIKGEYQEELQATLQGQLWQGNDVDVEFHG